MKPKVAYYAENYYWASVQEYIWDEDKNGPFFSGISVEYCAPKTNLYVNLTFRLCKKELK